MYVHVNRILEPAGST